MRCTVGGPQIMSKQLHQLLKVPRLLNVSVQVISYEVGVRLGLCAGGFAIADYEAAAVVGYQETTCQGHSSTAAKMSRH